MWILLKDILVCRDCIIPSHDCPIDYKEFAKMSPEKKRRTVRKLMPVAIRLYDDDNELYYTGYMSEGDDVDEFEPLDWAKEYAGCTSLKYRDAKSGKWHML